MSRVVVRNVQPDGLHGFRRGQLALEGLSETLNVVFAPNATGKSTLAKAIGLLLNPRNAGDATISGTVACDGQEESRLVRKKDPAYAGAPDRPEDYLLDIIRLLGGLDDAERKSLSQLVGRGVNIDPGVMPVVGNAAAIKAANDAKSNLARARKLGDSAAEDENRLPILKQAQAAAEAAAKSEHAVRAWRERRNAEQRVHTLREEIFTLISDFPGIGEQSDGAVATAKALASALQTAESAVETARSQLNRSHPDGALPPRQLSDTEQAHVAAMTLELTRARQDLASVLREQKQRAAEAAELHAKLIRAISEGDLTMLSDAMASDFSALAHAATEADLRRAQEATLTGYRRAREEWARRAPTYSTDPEETIQAICRWMEATPTQEEDRRGRILVAIAVAIPLLISFLPSLPARVAIAIAGALAAAYVWTALGPKGRGDNRPELARLAGLEPTATATEAANRLAKLSFARAHMDAGRALDTLAGDDLPPYDWQPIAQRLRLISNDPYQLAAVSRAAETHLKARADCAGMTAVVSDAEERVLHARQNLSSFFQTFAFPHDPAAPDEAEKVFFEWFVRSDNYTKALSVAGAKQDELNEFLDQSGVPPDPVLQERMRTLEGRVAPANKLRSLQKEVDAAEQILSKASHDPDLVRRALGMEPEFATDEKIEETISRLNQEALRRDEYFQQLVGCENRIAEIERNAALEEAEDRYSAAMRNVEVKWNEVFKESVRHRIKSHVTERMRTVELPEIIRNANDWVGSFTTGRYRLVMGQTGTGSKEGLGVLSVQDVQTGREQRFGELSTGTKVHVVLALRLGLIERHEQQANAGTRKFPLVADEVMAVSDPEASRALASALVEISGERQVIVFTNQPDDVKVFREVRPDVTVKTLTSDVPEPDPETELPLYRPPLGPRRLDLRLPIKAHAKEAILPTEMGEVADCEHIIEALEQLRSDLLRDYPRLSWDDVAAAGWTNNAFREELRDLAHRCGGDGQAFLAELAKLPRFRRTTVDEAETWLLDRGYLVGNPEESEIRRRANALPTGTIDAFQLEYIVRLLHSGFFN